MRTSYAVGVDVGGTRVAAGLIERKGRIVKEARTLTPKEAGPFAIVDAIIDLIEDVSSSGVHPSEIAGIGVGLPAQIDFLKQSVEFCTNLPLTGVDMRSLIMSRVRHSVTIDNDSNCAGIGESRFGAGKNVRDFVMITLGTGVGGSLFFNGEPYRDRAASPPRSVTWSSTSTGRLARAAAPVISSRSWAPARQHAAERPPARSVLTRCVRWRVAIRSRSPLSM